MTGSEAWTARSFGPRVRHLCHASVHVLTLALLASGALGCSRRAQVVLHQPFAPPSQQEIELESRWAFSAAAHGHRRCLLELPLPQNEDGPRDFRLYLTFADVSGVRSVAPDKPDGARGFLIQEVGRLSGRTEFTKGTIRFRRVLLQSRLRRLDLNLRCADGATITGKAYVETDDRELRRFEREFAADVNALHPDEVPPDVLGEPTAPRGSPP